MAFTFKHGDQPLDGYTVQRGVGRGGFGEVYYATADSGKEVALKYLRDNPQIELRGVSHCLNLKSPHLVTLYDIRQNADGEYFVIMEYVSGPSLREILVEAGNKLDVQRVAYFVREIAKGLTHLHDRGIVHRDLKPGNIFYEDGYVKIGDYGLSKFISASRHSAQTVSVGTVHYMAPEIGSGDYHAGTDIYAVGVMLYEMLLGRVPFEGSSMGEILMKHLTQQPEVDELPAPFPAVIRKALAKDPKERYQSATEMVADVFGIDEIERSVASFEPASLSTAARRAYEHVGAAASPLPPPPGVEGSSKIDVLADHVADTAARVADRAGHVVDRFDARVPPAHLAPVITAGERARRIMLTAVVAIGLGCAAGVLGGGENQPETTIAAICALLVVTFCSLFGSLTVLPHVRHEHRWVIRLVMAGLAAPVLFLLDGFLGIDGFDALIPPLLITLVIVDWVDRVRKGRQGIVSFGDAIGAALGALIAATITGDVPPAMFMGVAAAASLAVQATATSWPAATTEKAAQRTEGSSLIAAPFDRGHAERTDRTVRDDRRAHVPGHARGRGAPEPTTQVSRADQRRAFRMLFPAAGCFTGALVLLTIAITQDAPVVAACGVGCLVFAGLFSAEWLKHKRDGFAARRRARSPADRKRRRHRFAAGMATVAVGLLALATSVPHQSDSELLLTLAVAAGSVALASLVRLGPRVQDEEMRWGSAPPRRVPRSMGARVFWRLVSAGLITAMIVAAIAAPNGAFSRWRDEDVALAAAIAFAALNLTVFSLRKSAATRYSGFWADTARPLLLAVFISVAGTAVAALVAIGDLGRDESLVALGVLVGALVFAWSIYRLRGDEAGTNAEPAPGARPMRHERMPARHDETVTLGK